MSHRNDDLRATAEDLIADAERLKRVEQRKLDTDHDAPEADQLADEGEEIVRGMLPKTRAQKEISDGPDER